MPPILLCTARPELVEPDPTWAGTTSGSLPISLPPLGNPEIATMYAHLLGQAPFPADQLGLLEAESFERMSRLQNYRSSQISDMRIPTLYSLKDVPTR